MPDPLFQVRRKFALATNDHRLLQFFDDDIIAAVQQREKQYIERMTQIFTSQFKSKYAALINKLELSNARILSMDKRMEMLRSQLERRKLQSDQQRRAFLLEIIGLKQKKHSDENLQSLNDLVQRLEEGAIFHEDTFEPIETIDAEYNKAKANHAHIRKMKQEIMDLKGKIKLLENKTKNSEIKAFNLQRQNNDQEKILKQSNELREESDKTIKKLKEQITKLKMANKYANAELEKCKQKEGPEFWLKGKDGAKNLKVLLNAHLKDVMHPTDSQIVEFDVDVEENTYTALLELLHNEHMWDFVMPKLRGDYFDIFKKTSNDKASDDMDREHSATLKYLLDQIVAEKLYPMTSKYEAHMKEKNVMKDEIHRLEGELTKGNETLLLLERDLEKLKAKLKIEHAEKASLMIKKPRKDAFIQVDDAATEIHILTENIDELKMEVKRLKSHTTTLELAQQQSNKVDKDFNKQLKIFMDELNMKKDECDEANTEIDYLQKEVQTLSVKASTLAKENDRLEHEKKQLGRELEHIKHTKKTTNIADTDNEIFATKIKNLKHQLQISAKKQKILEDECTLLTEKIHTYEETIKTLKSSNQENEKSPSKIAFEKNDVISSVKTVSRGTSPISAVSMMTGSKSILEEQFEWSWLSAVHTEMAKANHAKVPEAVKCIHNLISSPKGKTVESENGINVILPSAHDVEKQKEQLQQVFKLTENLDDVENTKFHDMGALEKRKDTVNKIGLTPEVLKEALRAREWLISQQARMNWAVLTKRMLNHYHFLRVDFLNGVLEKHEAEKELDIHERLLQKGKRRANRLKLHRNRVVQNRSRATEQILSAAAVMAFDNFNLPAFKSRQFEMPVSIIPETARVEVHRRQNRPTTTNHNGHLLHTATIDLGTVPETQQKDLHKYHAKQSIDSCIPHASMGYFPARIMRMEKKKPFERNEGRAEKNESIHVEAKRTRKTKKKKLVKKRRKISPNNAGIHKEPQHMETSRGRVVRSMLKDIETTPTFREYQRDMWPDGTVFITGAEEDDEILVNPITIRHSRHKNSVPTRPKSARSSTTASRIRKGKMYEQMSNGIRISVMSKGRPMSARERREKPSTFEFVMTNTSNTK